MLGGHLREQVPGDVAQRVQLGVVRLPAGLEAAELGDRAGAEHADAQPARHAVGHGARR
jgi:hypothetical protein